MRRQPAFVLAVLATVLPFGGVSAQDAPGKTELRFGGTAMHLSMADPIGPFIQLGRGRASIDGYFATATDFRTGGAAFDWLIAERNNRLRTGYVLQLRTDLARLDSSELEASGEPLPRSTVAGAVNAVMHMTIPGSAKSNAALFVGAGAGWGSESFNDGASTRVSNGFTFISATAGVMLKVGPAFLDFGSLLSSNQSLVHPFFTLRFGAVL